MKKQLKRLIKAGRKRIRNQLRLSLVMTLSELAVQFQDSKKFKKLIEKSAKKFSKKIAKKLSIDVMTLPDVINQSNDVHASETFNVPVKNQKVPALPAKDNSPDSKMDRSNVQTGNKPSSIKRRVDKHPPIKKEFKSPADIS